MSNWRSDLVVNTNKISRRAALISLAFSPPFRAVCYYRGAAYWHSRGIFGKILSALLTRRLVHLFGCFISPKAIIGKALRLPHPTSIVIGEGCKIGDHVTIFQNVTIGRKDNLDTAYPIIEDDVTIYSGAVIVGSLKIGKGAIVGANSVVLSNVAPYTTFVGIPAKELHRKQLHL